MDDGDRIQPYKFTGDAKLRGVALTLQVVLSFEKALTEWINGLIGTS